MRWPSRASKCALPGAAWIKISPESPQAAGSDTSSPGRSPSPWPCSQHSLLYRSRTSICQHQLHCVIAGAQKLPSTLKSRGFWGVFLAALSSGEMEARPRSALLGSLCPMALGAFPGWFGVVLCCTVPADLHTSTNGYFRLFGHSWGAFGHKSEAKPGP